MANPPVQLAGLASNLDWKGLIESIRAGSKQALDTTVGAQLVRVESRKVLFNNFDAQLSKIRTAVSSLASTRNLIFKVPNSSDEGVAIATATSSTQKGSNAIVVTTLANQESHSASYADAASTAVTTSDANLVINVRGESNTIALSAGDSLQDMADKINEAGIGVRATVFDSGLGGATPFRLTITDNKTGKFYETASDNITIDTSALTGGDVPTFGKVVGTGVDLALTVNGNSLQRESNTVSDAIPGLVLNIIGTGRSTITVTESSIDLSKQVQTFINEYNAIVRGLNEEFKYVPSELLSNKQALTRTSAGRTALRSLQSQFREMLGFRVNGFEDGVPRSLSDIGVVVDETAKDGTLKLDSSRFSQATSTANIDNFKKFWFGDEESGLTGFIDNMSSRLSELASGPNGILSNVISSFEEQSRRLNDRYNQQIERIDRMEQRLTRQFAGLENVLSGLYQQQGFLQQAFDQMGRSGRR